MSRCRRDSQTLCFTTHYPEDQTSARSPRRSSQDDAIAAKMTQTLPERARRPPALAHGAILVRGAEPLVAFQDAGASFGAGFGPASHGHAPLLARDRTRRLRPPRRAVRVLLDVERMTRGGLPSAPNAFVEAEVVLGRFAHLVVEVARDDLRGRGGIISTPLPRSRRDRHGTPSMRRSEEAEG